MYISALLILTDGWMTRRAEWKKVAQAAVTGGNRGVGTRREGPGMNETGEHSQGWRGREGISQGYRRGRRMWQTRRNEGEVNRVEEMVAVGWARQRRDGTDSRVRWTARSEFWGSKG